MTPQWISQANLWILNMALDHDPVLRKTVFDAIKDMAAKAQESAKGLTDHAPAEGATGPQAALDTQSKTAEIEPQILAWFTARPGKHTLTECRAAMGVPATSKPFKTAVANLVSSKGLKFNGKRGKGSEYWA